MVGIYAILNTKTNKRYIGQSTNIKRRYYNHIWKLKNNRHENLKLQEAWNTSEEQDFILEIIELIEEIDREKMVLLEIEYIKKYDSYYNGYNNSYGADGSKYNNPTEEFRKKTSKRMKGNQYSLGIKHSYETRTKMSESFKHRKDIKEHAERARKNLKKLWEDEDYRSKMLEMNKGNKYSLGRKATEKEKRAMSERQKGEKNTFYNKSHSEISRKKMSVKSKERWQNEDYRKKVRSKMDKVMQTEEYRNKISIKSRGENNNTSKVTELDAINIRLRYLRGEKAKDILKDYKHLSESGLKKICYNNTWKHLPNNTKELEYMLINYQSK